MNVYIEVTNLLSQNFLSGIQRVVIEITTRLIKSEKVDVHLFYCDVKRRCYIVDNTKFYNYYTYQSADKNGCKTEKRFDLDSINAGDVYFEIDSTWPNPIPRGELFSKLKEKGVKIVCLIYDIIGITHPQYTDSGLINSFAPYLVAILVYADLIICNTQFTVDQVKLLCKTYDIQLPSFGVVNLGADFTVNPNADMKVDPRAEDIASNRRYILTVGTIEPRKNHKLLLDAYDSGLEKYNVSLVFAGRTGWAVDELLQRMHSHSSWNKQIFHLEGLNDASISYLYDHAYMVANPSFIEGYGIPVVEGLMHNVPSMVSDIPVFHEIGGEYCDYFNPESPDDVIEIVARYINDDNSYKKRKTILKSFQPYTWDKASAKVIDYFENVVYSPARNTASIKMIQNIKQQVCEQREKCDVPALGDNVAASFKGELEHLKCDQIHYDRELKSKSKSLRKIVIFIKRIIRKLNRFLLEPIVGEINNHNSHINNALFIQYQIDERFFELEQKVKDLEDENKNLRTLISSSEKNDSDYGDDK